MTPSEALTFLADLQDAYGATLEQRRIERYAEHLIDYPAELRNSVQREAERRFKFFPSIAELVAVFTHHAIGHLPSPPEAWAEAVANLNPALDEYRRLDGSRAVQPIIYSHDLIRYAVQAFGASAIEEIASGYGDYGETRRAFEARYQSIRDAALATGRLPIGVEAGNRDRQLEVAEWQRRELDQPRRAELMPARGERSAPPPIVHEMVKKLERRIRDLDNHDS